jgi:hypothetical protein
VEKKTSAAENSERNIVCNGKREKKSEKRETLTIRQ